MPRCALCHFNTLSLESQHFCLPGTEVGSAVEIIYGSEEEAKKWIDVDSYNRVVGRSDLPAYAETNLTAYSDVVAAMKEPVMNALGGGIVGLVQGVLIVGLLIWLAPRLGIELPTDGSYLLRLFSAVLR